MTSTYTREQKSKFFNNSKQWLLSPATITDYDNLVETLKFHEWAYYVASESLIGDQEYDQLYKQLESIESEMDNIRPDSPTQRVSNDLKGDSNTVDHLVPMLSLGNSYNAEDLLDFNKSVLKNAFLDEGTTVQYTVEPKYDGGSIALVYEEDRLIRAATRGNGVKGEEMTQNARAMSSVPLMAAFSQYGIYKAELRGESIIAKSDFEKINQRRLENGEDLFANPRNAATGGLRTKDANETKIRRIQTFVFQLGYAVDKDGNDLIPKLKTHHDCLLLLGRLGFKTPDQGTKLCNNIEEAIDFCVNFESQRDDYGYELDGMVVKVNDYALQEKIGYTQHHPKWAIAYKFKAKQATTKLIGVEYQVGKIGSITPVAKLDPVQLAGVTVSNVSLHNADFISERDLRIGDTVVVERAGDVIPYIVKALDDLRDGTELPITFPTHCPDCGPDRLPLIRAEGEAAFRCVNPDCKAQILQRLIFHVSKDAMDIDGFGKSYVEKFYELGWLNDFADVYNLPYDEIEQLEGFGSRSVTKLKEAIEVAKQNPIHRLLHSLTIHHLGKKGGKIFAQEVNHVLDFQSWTLEDFEGIKDIGPVLAKNMVDFFADESNINLLQKMESYGVNLTQTEADQPVKVADDAPLLGKTILFTGSLQTMGRKEAQQLAEKAGAKNISAVSSKLNILVAGEKAGSKLKKANALGTIEVMTEQEFLELVR